MTISSKELVDQAKDRSKDPSLPEDVRELLWLVATLAKDRENSLKFLINQLSSLSSHCIRFAEIEGIELTEYGVLK